MPLDFAAAGCDYCWLSLALPAKRPFDSLAAVADFLDGFLHRSFWTASLPRFVARLIILPARDTRAILFASATTLLRSPLRHPQSSFVPENNSRRHRKF